MNFSDESKTVQGCAIVRGLVGDVGALRMRPRMWVAEQGFNLIEIIVALAVVAAAIGIAFPMLNSAPQNLAADLQDFSLNLQVARELGTSRTEHYRVRVFSAGPPYKYAIEGFNGTQWNTERTMTLRPNVTFTGATLGQIAEFDTRGMLVTPAPLAFTLKDIARGWTKQVTVNAVGMVDRP
jgi:prepilin-type N-terminal cleavage/methylation domain-containing protein